MWGVGGLQVHRIRSRRLVCKEVVETLSNYDNQEILLLVICEVWIEKTRVEYLLDVFEERWEKGHCDLVCVDAFRSLG